MITKLQTLRYPIRLQQIPDLVQGLKIKASHRLDRDFCFLLHKSNMPKGFKSPNYISPTIVFTCNRFYIHISQFLFYLDIRASIISSPWFNSVRAFRFYQNFAPRFILSSLNINNTTVTMSQTSSTLSTQIKVLLFGSQALTFNNESFQALRKILTEPPNATHWALEVLQELPKYWDSLAKLIPSIRQFSGDEKLRELIELLHTDSVPDSSFPFPNIILTPLEVILQLIQYERLLQLNLRNDKEKIDKILPPDVTVIGLCTGALSAAAASLSATKSEFFQNAAVAIRLAMLIGTIVDAEDISRGPHREATSFSVSWISKESEAKLHDALASYTDVRVS